MKENLGQVIGHSTMSGLSTRRLELITEFIERRNLNWRYIDTGMTAITANEVIYRCGTGEVFRINSKPLYTSSDSRRAVFRRCESNDILLVEVYGGFDAIISRLGHIIMVLPIKEKTEKWNRLMQKIESRKSNI
jgi:hypothetical protein